MTAARRRRDAAHAAKAMPSALVPAAHASSGSAIPAQGTRANARQARRWRLGGQVQGVGFRPFVFRLASSYRLAGWVQNQLGAVEVFAQGAAGDLARFERDLLERAPPLARPVLLTRERTASIGAVRGFRIRASDEASQPQIHVPPDYFTCDDCLEELRRPTDRRFRYPFINCTQCGPRYTLIERLPYDRPHTAMRMFALCTACRKEYDDPIDRRFHAEPVACPACGPRLQLDPGNRRGEAALTGSVAALRAGSILAVKGVGGYHLMCDAANDAAVARLRERKRRPDKPLALMFPWRGADGLDAVRAACQLHPLERQQLTDPMRPIVLVQHVPGCRLSPRIAPGLRELGVMLPYSPLHHLLLGDFGAPVVATSGNLSGEPVLTDNGEAQRRLVHIADAFLHHDRPILRPADDAVVRRVSRTMRPLRLGRGGAPLEIELGTSLPRPVLALGAHMKNTVALAWGERAVISPHIGDMGTPRSLAVFERLVQDLQRLYQVSAEAVVCDAHPGYATTRWADRQALPVTRVFHHYAHASALAGELGGDGPYLVFTWDGVGYGEDGTLWGGEALLGAPGGWRRVARLRPFRLPGGERASREPWRSAAGLCWEAGVEWRECPHDTGLLFAAWRKRINAPETSAAGRLFDAAAALLGVNLSASFEGQGPMYLEALARTDARSLPLPLRQTTPDLLESDWQPLLPLLTDNTLSLAERSGVFHATLARALLDQALAVRERHRVEAVGLCGGVFQNRLLSEHCEALLRAHGFAVCLPQKLPVNDAAISCGQIIEYAALSRDARR